MPTNCHGQKYTTSSAPCLQYAWLPGCFSQDYLIISLIVSWEHLLKMCLQAAAVGDGSIASSLPAPPCLLSPYLSHL